jgi:hypothetical protein
MKLTYNWLKRYVDLDGSPQELAEKLVVRDNLECSDSSELCRSVA